MLDSQSIVFFSAGFVICLCLAILKIIKTRGTREINSIERIIFIYLFITYICGLISLTLLPIFNFVRDEPDFSINIIPFKMFLDFAGIWDSFGLFFSIKVIVINIIGNILLFLPLGFFVCALNPKLGKMKYILIIGAASSLLIESLQYIETQTRVTGYRSSDVDDIIFNTLGCLIGFLFFKILNKNKKVNKFLNKVENKKNIL